VYSGNRALLVLDLFTLVSLIHTLTSAAGKTVSKSLQQICTQLTPWQPSTD